MPNAGATRRSVTTSVVALFLMSGPAWASGGASAPDVSADFVVGYATAVLEQIHDLSGFEVDYLWLSDPGETDLGSSDASVPDARMDSPLERPPQTPTGNEAPAPSITTAADAPIAGGLLRVNFPRTPETPLDTIERLLLHVSGVDQVELSVRGVLVTRSQPPRAAGATPGPDGTAATADEKRSQAPGRRSDAPRADTEYDILSAQEMFEPLLADPRWPHFSAIHQWYLDDDELERVGSANFGESFAFVRSPDLAWGQWEIGLQAGVFSVFDLESNSNDLVNSDFLVGLTATHHYGDFTTMLRLYHQSSHLGDEYLLRNRVDRVNLSFEVLDLLVSFDPWQWLRLYAGGGLLVHRDPALDRGLIQTGIELESPVAFAHGYLRPIAGADFQFRQESDWQIDASVRAGIQIEHPFLRRTRLRVLGEFYSGRSPNGQFFERSIRTLGVGLHLNF